VVIHITFLNTQTEKTRPENGNTVKILITIIQWETQDIIKQRRFNIFEQVLNSFTCSSFVYNCSFFLLTIVDYYSTHKYTTNTFYVEESHIRQVDLLE
jgi:hypothetical protein